MTQVKTIMDSDLIVISLIAIRSIARRAHSNSHRRICCTSPCTRRVPHFGVSSVFGLSVGT
jgi:hypothetical protein